MTFPLWAVFGLTAAALSACMLLLQERLQVNGYALAFWNKVACILVTAPFVWVFGFPDNPTFYLFLGLGAILFAINDVVFFTQLPKVGAGSVSRLLPAATVLTFMLWFILDPGLFRTYAAKPEIAVPIFFVLCAFAFFASQMKKCEISMNALKALWFVLFASVFGSLNIKFITTQADPGQGPYAYVFTEAWMMITLWMIYLIIRKPVPLSTYTRSWKPGLTIGAVTATMVLSSIAAFFYVDNPAYIGAIKGLDAVIILFIYKMWGKKAQGNVKAGLGIVACAALLIILKAQI